MRFSAGLAQAFASVTMALFTAPAPAEPLESLTVRYNALTCEPLQGGHANLRAPIEASVSSLSKNFSYEQIVSPRSDTGAAAATFHVVPDAYYIQGYQEKTGCTPPYGTVEIVLPGHPVSTNVDLANCCHDAPHDTHVAGLVPTDAGLRIVGVFPRIPCGAAVDDRALQPQRGALTRVGNAYYGTVEDDDEETLILELWDSTRTGFLQLSPDYKATSPTSTYQRFNVTSEMLRRVLSAGNTLVCDATAR